MKLNQIAFALVVSLGVAGIAHAAPAQSSNTNYINVDPDVGAQPGHPGSGPGIGISTLYNGTLVNFAGLASFPTVTTGNVTHIDWNTAILPATHKAGVGSLTFAAADTNVYFGEWFAQAKDANGNPVNAVDTATHTVYYAGKDADTSVPSVGTATYSVQGINNSNVTTGTFVADFQAKTLDGSIGAFNLGVATINNDASITGNNASWTGGPTGGTVAGQFYNGQSSLAGYATFLGNQSYDIAFGGKQ